MDLLLITDKNKSHFVYIKTFNRFMWNKIKLRTKKHFCKYCLQYFSSERVLIEHKKLVIDSSKQFLKNIVILKM